MSFFFLGEGDSIFMDLAFRDSDFRARVGFGVVGVTEGCKSSDLTFTDPECFARFDRLGLWV